MKKVLCAILTAALLLTSVLPAFAVSNIEVQENAIAEMMDAFCEYMPSDPNKRIRIWTAFKAYMIDGTNGIDTIIAALKDESPLPEYDDMQKIFNQFVNLVKDEYGEEFIFMLELYRNTNLSARKASLNKFGADPVPLGNGKYEEIVKTPLPLSAEQKTAAESLFGAYITTEAEGKLEVHSIDIANFLNLLTPFKGRFQMTDGENGKFALASYSKSFAEGLANTMSYSEINGVEIDSNLNAEARGYQIITGIVEMFNSFTNQQIKDMKTVLAHTDISLYKKGLDVADDPSAPDEGDDEDEGGSGSGSGSGSTGGYGGNSRPGNRYDNKEFVLEEPLYNENTTLPSDVEAGSWAAPYILNLAERKIFIGYEDGTFRPELGITRQEIAVALVRAMGMEADAKAATASSKFADDDNIADWARGYVNIAVSKNIFTGYGDGEFKPTRTISRQELVTVLMRLSGDAVTSTVMNYADIDEIHGYARPHIGRATNLGIVDGYPDGTFKPLNFVTRAEAAKMVYNGLEYYTYLGK